MRILLKIIAAIVVISAFQYCSTKSRATHSMNGDNNQQGEISVDNATAPPVIVYKTRSDYSNQVAVTLNADKTKIISYPHPRDLYLDGKLSKPTDLGNGYLLDNQGITTQVAFTNFTFEQYAKLDTPPTLDKLWDKLVDKNPLLIFCNCGSRHQYQNLDEDLKELVKRDLKPCKKVIAKD